MKRPGLFFIVGVLVILSLACGKASYATEPVETVQTVLLPTEPEPTAIKAPTNTLPPTATLPPPTATLTATPKPIDYVITDPAFDVEVDDTCSGDIEISSVEGDSFGVGGTIPMINDAWVLWCYGAKHTWLGTLEYGGYTFTSSASDPLQFVITREGYRYEGGTGIVTQPDGSEVKLGGALPAVTIVPTTEAAPTAAPTSGSGDGLDETGFETVLFDPFDNNSNDWPIVHYMDDYGLYDTQIETGSYNWSIDSYQAPMWYAYPEMGTYANYVASVDVLPFRGNTEARSFGLLLSWFNESNFCVYFVTNSGDYSVQCLIDSVWEDVVSWEITDAYNPGETNRLWVKVEDFHYTFAVNGTVIAEADFDKLGRGKVGLVVYVFDPNLSTNYSFDNFELKTSEP